LENLGTWDKYGYSGQIIALLRGACTHWAWTVGFGGGIRFMEDDRPKRFLGDGPRRSPAGQY
jgi:hypothetical protein